ncbi:MAG: hypothetical protein H7345_11660 [Rubritepida sp.]|nr:hypothetical protein [Rubritepida sp.]
MRPTRGLEPASWQLHEIFDGSNLLGHERLYMPDGPRYAMREMRLNAVSKASIALGSRGWAERVRRPP